MGRLDMRLDVGKLALQSLALRGKILIGHAGVLQGGEDEQALGVAERNNPRRPMSQEFFARAAIHIDDPGARVRIDAEEDFALGRRHLVPAGGIALQLLAEQRRPFRQVLDL